MTWRVRVRKCVFIYLMPEYMDVEVQRRADLNLRMTVVGCLTRVDLATSCCGTGNSLEVPYAVPAPD
jgi:hypothetical protein